VRVIELFTKEQNMTKVGSFKDLIVYSKAYKLAMEIFEIYKSFPKKEKYVYLQLDCLNA